MLLCRIYLGYIVPAYYVLTTVEASSNLSRYVGISYGHRTKEPADLLNFYKKDRSEGFGAEAKKTHSAGNICAK